MKQETKKIILENVRPRIKGTPDIDIINCVDFYLPSEDLKFLDFYLNNKPNKAFMGIYAILVEFLATVIIDDIIQKRASESLLMLKAAADKEKKIDIFLYKLLLIFSLGIIIALCSYLLIQNIK